MTKNSVLLSEQRNTMLSPTDEKVRFNSKNAKSNITSFFGQNLLAILTLLAVILAIVIGVIIKNTTGKWSERSVMYLEFPGDMFLRMLKCLILPLIISSLISSLGSLDSKISGQIGKRAVIYYLTTTVIAIFLGIIFVLIIRPGNPNIAGEQKSMPERRIVTTEDTILDLIRNLIPPNLVEACFAMYSTTLSPLNNETDIHKWKIRGTYGGGTNILGLVVFSIVFGAILARMKNDSKPLLTFFTSLNEVTMKMTNIVIKFTPVGVMFLVMSRVVSIDDMRTMLSSVGLYSLTVLIGLFSHGLLILPLIYYVITRKNPYIFLIKMSEAIMTAFGTSSSSASLPITIKCLEEKNNVDRNIVRFCTPIGATINMDGTALYEAVAAIFIAQSRNIEMNLAKVIIISITATAASIGAAGIPQAGLITMVIVLNAVGLPAEDVAMIIMIDWLLDRFRTSINVIGDAFGAGIVEHMSRNDLRKFNNKIEDDLIENNGLKLLPTFTSSDVAIINNIDKESEGNVNRNTK